MKPRHTPYPSLQQFHKTGIQPANSKPPPPLFSVHGCLLLAIIFEFELLCLRTVNFCQNIYTLVQNSNTKSGRKTPDTNPRERFSWQDDYKYTSSVSCAKVWHSYCNVPSSGCCSHFAVYRKMGFLENALSPLLQTGNCWQIQR